MRPIKLGRADLHVWKWEDGRRVAGVFALHFPWKSKLYALHFPVFDTYQWVWGKRWEPFVGDMEYGLGPLFLLVHDPEI